MSSSRILAVALASLCCAVALAADTVGVSGSNVRFPVDVEKTINGKQAKLVLTGTALRKKLFFSVYAMGSYVQEGAKVRNAEELAAAECPKLLHLVMERTVSGKDVAEAFRTSIRANYPAPAFTEEIEALQEVLGSTTIQRGDEVWLTQVPNVGLHCRLEGKTERLIKNPQFCRAIWDIYLGKNNLGETIKKGLVSRL